MITQIFFEHDNTNIVSKSNLILQGESSTTFRPHHQDKVLQKYFIIIEIHNS